MARLGDELSLTVAFAAAMERSGNRRAAIGVLDEQRSRVQASQRAMLHEFARPRKHKIHAALAGLAAAVLASSASFAGFRALAPHTQPAKSTLSQASTRLAEAQNVSGDTQELATIFGDVHRSILALSVKDLQDPGNRNVLKGIIDQELQLLKDAPNASALIAQVKAVAKQAQVPVPETKKPEAPSNPSPPAADAPAPPK